MRENVSGGDIVVPVKCASSCGPTSVDGSQVSRARAVSRLTYNRGAGKMKDHQGQSEERNIRSAPCGSGHRVVKAVQVGY